MKREQCIVFTLKDGSVWGLPLRVVAEARAKHYAEKDKDTTFQEELEYVLADDFEGIDWFQNNQNPEDFYGHYFQIECADDVSLADRIRDCEELRIASAEVPLPTGDGEKVKAAEPEPHKRPECPPHTWDRSGERCVMCGDKDWMT